MQQLTNLIIQASILKLINDEKRNVGYCEQLLNKTVFEYNNI